MKKKCLLVCLLCCLLFGLALAEEPMTETVLFEGSQPASGGWNLALTIDTTNVNGTFDPSLISENGYFAVTYDGVQNGVYLALSDWGRRRVGANQRAVHLHADGWNVHGGLFV